MTLAPVAAAALLLAVHLAAEARGQAAARALGKVGASLAVIALALARGAAGGGALDQALLAGLCLSTVGDALLLSPARTAFLAGLVAFLLAHVAYAAGFATVLAAPAAWAAAPLGVAFALVLRWLWPHLGTMRAPVVAYCVVISLMVWLALGTGRGTVIAGALLFYVSDLTVARDRFVKEAFANRLVGLPLYYAAQVLLALSTGRG
ncbi:MAG: lysoplasmalogenase [Anaeromyxobacteraceae bacterium]